MSHRKKPHSSLSSLGDESMKNILLIESLGKRELVMPTGHTCTY